MCTTLLHTHPPTSPYLCVCGYAHRSTSILVKTLPPFIPLTSPPLPLPLSVLWFRCAGGPPLPTLQASFGPAQQVGNSLGQALSRWKSSLSTPSPLSPNKKGIASRLSPNPRHTPSPLTSLYDNKGPCLLVVTSRFLRLEMWGGQGVAELGDAEGHSLQASVSSPQKDQ